MFKVIVERPRSGRSRASKSKLRYDKCEERSRVSGHRLVMESGGYTKHLNENLAPLKRYLHKQLGRRWDDVFSEICAHLDTGSTVKMHVREHLEDFVLSKVRRDKDGTLWATGRWGAPEKLVESWTALYVDPEDGVVKETRKLCQNLGVPFRRSRWRYKYWGGPKKQLPLHKLSATTWHIQLKGIWYFIELSAVPLGQWGYCVSDEGVYETIVNGTWRDQKEWSLICKKQLSTKTLKALNLQNSYSCQEETYYG
ncbi:MAG: hypothetical protein ABJN69_04670 [Hellea sp.]